MSTTIKEYGSCNICNRAYWKKDLSKAIDVSGYSFKDDKKPVVFLCKSCIKKLDSPVGAAPREYQSGDDFPALRL